MRYIFKFSKPEKVRVLIIFLVLSVILGGCAMSVEPAESIEPTESIKLIESIEWGKITNFYMSWGSFNDGHWTFSIDEEDGQYIMNATGSNGVQMFVPENQPIQVYEVDAICQILKDNGIDRWNGFDERDNKIEDGLSFRIVVKMDTGSAIKAYGYEMFPKGFDEAFKPLDAYLMNMSERYKAEPEWGSLNYMSFRIGVNTEYSVEQRDKAVNFRRSPRFHGDEALRGVFEADVLEKLNQIMKEYGIDRWWDKSQISTTREPYHFERRICVEVGFDNGAGFQSSGWATQNAVNAFTEFFEDLADQAERVAR